jgi:hypothetical protein
MSVVVGFAAVLGTRRFQVNVKAWDSTSDAQLRI